MNHLAEREVWMNLFKSQKSGDREKVRQQEALLKRQEQEKKEEEVLGVSDRGLCCENTIAFIDDNFC